MKIRKGDQVVVLSGKDRGKQGEVISVDKKKNRVLVEGVNVAKRHQKPTRAMEQGGIIDKAMPVDVSNVALIDSDGNASRVGYNVDADGKKVRVARSNGGTI